MVPSVRGRGIAHCFLFPQFQTLASASARRSPRTDGVYAIVPRTHHPEIHVLLWLRSATASAAECVIFWATSGAESLFTLEFEKGPAYRIWLKKHESTLDLRFRVGDDGLIQPADPLSNYDYVFHPLGSRTAGFAPHYQQHTISFEVTSMRIDLGQAIKIGSVVWVGRDGPILRAHVSFDGRSLKMIICTGVVFVIEHDQYQRSLPIQVWVEDDALSATSSKQVVPVR